MANLFQAAEGYEQRGLIDEAINTYGRIADAGLGGPETLIRKALLKSQRGDIKSAMRDLERAENAKPSSVYPRMRLGHLTGGMGRKIVTVEHMRAALEIEPWHVEVRVNLAAAYTRAAWFDLARHVALSLPAELSDWWAEVRQVAISEYTETRRATLAALRRRRSEEMGHGKLFDLAKCLYRLGRLHTARRICEKIMRENPDWFLPFWLVSDIVARQTGPDAALAYLRSSYRMPDVPEAYVEADFLEAETGLLNEAGRYDELWRRLETQPETEGREHFRHVAAVAAFMTDRDPELKRHCLKWMEESPLAAIPAGFIVLMHARAASWRRPEPRPARVHIAQFWNTGSPPSDVEAAMASWTRLNPNWRRTLFDEDSARAFLSSRFGSDAVEAFSHCYHAAMMADFFRIAFLYASGGFYADADEGCVRPIDIILPNVDGYEVVAPRADGLPGFVDTPFLGARQGGRVMRLVLKDIIKNILLAAHTGGRPPIWEVTGPGALTRGVARFLAAENRGSGDEILLLPFQQFRAYVQTQDLLYKRDAKMNWRMATVD